MIVDLFLVSFKYSHVRSLWKYTSLSEVVSTNDLEVSLLYFTGNLFLILVIERIFPVPFFQPYSAVFV